LTRGEQPKNMKNQQSSACFDVQARARPMIIPALT